MTLRRRTRFSWRKRKPCSKAVQPGFAATLWTGWDEGDYFNISWVLEMIGETSSLADFSSEGHKKLASGPPSGARFYRCALQVNPFAYLQRHSKQSDFRSEDEYNQAIVDACQKNDIEVIAVTDHYRVKDSYRLLQAARAAGIHAFGGFEAVTKDGVHFLCLFDQEKEDNLDRYLGRLRHS